MLDRLLQTDTTVKSRLIRPSALKDVLAELEGTSDGKQFSEMKEMLDQEDRETFILTRFAAPRAAAEASTPWYIKNLRPPMAKCYLTFQVATKSFQGYYPKDLDESQRKNPKVKTHWSTSRNIWGEMDNRAGSHTGREILVEQTQEGRSCYLLPKVEIVFNCKICFSESFFLD